MATHDRTDPTTSDQAQLQDDIEATRARLGATVEQLSKKLDVGHQAKRHRTELIAVAGGMATLVLLIVVWRRKH